MKPKRKVSQVSEVGYGDEGREISVDGVFPTFGTKKSL